MYFYRFSTAKIVVAPESWRFVIQERRIRLAYNNSLSKNKPPLSQILLNNVVVISIEANISNLIFCALQALE